MEMNVKVVERYKPKLTHHYGHVYKDVLDIADIVYVLNINGKDSYRHYATKEEAEQAALKYNRDNYLIELNYKAKSKLQEMTKFRFRLSRLNHVYSTWKGQCQYKWHGGEEFYNSFIEDNPVIKLLGPKEQHKCLIALMKDRLKNRIAEYYKLKKEYLDIKKEIEKVKTSDT